MRFVLTLFALTARLLASDELFETKVRPLLARECYGCHGQARMGGLRLDQRESALRVIAPGQPDESRLMRAVLRTDPKLKMPPAKALAAEDVEVLRVWIRAGAIWPERTTAAPSAAFWSWQPLTMPAAPADRPQAAPIDRFLLAALDAKGLRPTPPADRRTLIRRVTLDLTGLPPSPDDVESFVNDHSPQAFARVVDRLLASPHYGERWARYWLDLARYSDGQLAAGADTPLPNAWRYRDWVIAAFNSDLPYDQFVRAQIAADGLNDHALLPGLGFQALAASEHDQVDTTTKVFLGLTVGCAQCHDHKYDPIPTRDYYSLYGVFHSTQMEKLPLVSKQEVERFEAQKKRVDALQETIDDYLKEQQKSLVDMLARHTARYMAAAWKLQQGGSPDKKGLDDETLQRWVGYLKPDKEHPYLKPWFDAVAKNPTGTEVAQAAERFQAFALELLDEAKEVDDKNYVAFGGRKGSKTEATRQYTNIVSLPVLKFYQWRELANGPYNTDGFRAPAGVYYYGPKEIERWLSGFAKDHLEQLRAEKNALENDLPPAYAFLHAVKDKDQPADAKVMIRGEARTLGEIAPRRFLSALSVGEAKPFTQGSGRRELAEAIVNSPLAARVMANRVWQHHFGQGLVRTPSNFGQMGERPSHPELLDYLAFRLVSQRWSVKALHREILLSDAYARSTAQIAANVQVDPGNQLLWRANVRPRLDLEALRDASLAVSGQLDTQTGGAATALTDANRRRTIYLTVSRTRLDPGMALFDFPDANATADDRPTTLGPLQGLFFLNSKFIAQQARALDERLTREAGADPAARIDRAYRLFYARPPDAAEIQAGVEYMRGDNQAWPRYLQALLGSAEFTSVH